MSRWHRWYWPFHRWGYTAYQGVPGAGVMAYRACLGCTVTQWWWTSTHSRN